jgi:hypothetical protein
MSAVNEIAAKMALVLVKSWNSLAGETETLYVLNKADREILAFAALGIIAEHQDGFVSEQDILLAAWSFATSPEEIRPIALDLYDALRACQ